MPLLEVKDLRKWYPVGGGWGARPRWLKAVDGVSFTAEAGETVGLVGESGCGKTTLGKAIVRLEEPSSGQVCVGGRDVTVLRGAALRRSRTDFQMIFQDPYSSLNPRLTLGAVLDETLRYHSPLDKAGRQGRCAELMELVGLGRGLLGRYPQQLSGGQRQRVGVAKALAVNPKLIVADEPVSALDVSVQAQIVNLLDDVQERTGVAIVFIAHDLAVVEHLSDRVLVMYLGKLVESASAELIGSDPRHPYTRALLAAVPGQGMAANRTDAALPGDAPSPLDPPPGCPFHPRCPVARERCRHDIPALLPTGATGQLSACHFAAELPKRGLP